MICTPLLRMHSANDAWTIAEGCEGFSRLNEAELAIPRTKYSNGRPPPNAKRFQHLAR